MHFTQQLVLGLTAGVLSPALAKPVKVELTITVDDDGSTVTSTSNANKGDTLSSQYADDPVFCNGTAYNLTLLDTYVCGDARLGPKKLPKDAPPLGSLLSSYNQLGGYSPDAFLETWYNASGNSWLWPPQDGFILDDDTGDAIKGNYSLPVGTYVDRFGYDSGKFLAPVSTAFVLRALPPSSLDTPQDNPR